MAGTPLRMVLTLACVLAGMGCQGSEITPQMRREDPRLASLVSVSATNVPVADLLQRFSKASGIEMKISSYASGSGVPVCAYAKKIPVGDLMEGLAAELSSSHWLWRWERNGDPVRFAYRLTSPRLDTLAARWAQFSQREFEKSYTFLASMTDKPERERMRLMGNDETMRLVAQSQRLFDGLAMFKEALTPEQQLSVLRGGKPIEVPMSRLSHRSREAIRNDARTSQRPDLLSDKVQFYTFRDQTDTGNGLYIAYGFGGYGYAGCVPLENLLITAIENEWTLAGDSRSSPLSATTLRPASQPADTSGPPGNRESANLGQYLESIAETTGSAVFAMLPEFSGVNDLFSPPDGGTLREYLDRLRNNRWHFVHKWRGSTLLLNYPKWFFEADSFPAYAAVKNLRQIFQKPLGDLDLKLLADLTFDMSESALRRLEGEMSLMKIPRAMRVPMTLLHHSKGMDREGGASLSDEMRRYIVEAGHVQPHRAAAASRMRFTKRASEDTRRESVEVIFEIVDSNGFAVMGQRCRYDRPKPNALAAPR